MPAELTRPSRPRPSKEQLARRHARQRSLTPEQVREIRLSMESPKKLAAVMGVSESAIRQARRGVNHGPLRIDERAAEAQRERVHDPIVEGYYQTHHALIVAPEPHVPALVHGDGQVALATGLPVGNPFTIDPRFADDECKHGRLPGDRTPPCGCWPQEQTNPTPINRRTNGNHDEPSTDHRARVARFAAQVHAGPDHGRLADDRAKVA